MRSVIRKAAAALACLLVLSAATALAETPAGLENFPVGYGDRESRKIAITMDDANEREYVWKAAKMLGLKQKRITQKSRQKKKFQKFHKKKKI